MQVIFHVTIEYMFLLDRHIKFSQQKKRCLTKYKFGAQLKLIDHG